MKILHCLGSLNIGGAETLVMNIMQNIDRDKFQFDFLLFDNKSGYYDRLAKGLGANLFYCPNIRSVGIKKYLNDLIKFFSTNTFDVIHSHLDWQGGFIAYAAKKAGIKKIIVHAHADQEMFKSNLQHRILIAYNKHLIKKYSTMLFACSKKAGASLFGERSSFIIIENGIDVDKFIYPNVDKIKILKDQFYISDQDIILGNVGSLSKNKNHKFLLDIMRDLVKLNKHFKLIIVGTGGEKDALVHIVKQYDLEQHVIFAGLRNDIQDMMHLFRIFLFPSLKEGLGIVAVEAQYSGTPCIISNTITNELDLGVNLVTFVSLRVQDWCEVILSECREMKACLDIKNTEHFNIKHTCKKLEIYYSKL